MTDGVKLSSDNHILQVQLNRPQRKNALTMRFITCVPIIAAVEGLAVGIGATMLLQLKTPGSSRIRRAPKQQSCPSPCAPPHG